MLVSSSRVTFIERCSCEPARVRMYELDNETSISVLTDKRWMTAKVKRPQHIYSKAPTSMYSSKPFLSQNTQCCAVQIYQNVFHVSALEWQN